MADKNQAGYISHAYRLPTSLIVGGVAHEINSDWQTIVDVLCVCGSPNLTDEEKALYTIHEIFPEWKKIPVELLPEACRKACEFVDCGHINDGKPKPKMIDWGQDAAIIIPEVNKVAGREVRLDPSIHWWTFFGWFMGIGDGLLASVLHIRQKKATGKKLEKWEQEFYTANKSMVDMKSPESEEVKAEKANMLKYL